MNNPDLIKFEPKTRLNWKLSGKINFDSGLITSELTDCSNQITKWIMDTRDKQTREALIKLGWTPPPDEQP